MHDVEVGDTFLGFLLLMQALGGTLRYPSVTVRMAVSVGTARADVSEIQSNRGLCFVLGMSMAAA